MSDYGKLQRPEASAMDAAESAHEGPGAVLEDPAAARGRTGDELKFRASGGRGGVAPMQRLIDERRAMGSALAGRVQRKADGAGAGAGVEIPEGGGAKLPSAVRSRMEPKLGADLSDVQVHTGGGSAKAAAGLGARAFTVGNDVHFNAGEFAPGSKEGDRLLAHELTHVVQGKKSGVQRKPNDNTNAAGGGGANANEHAAGGGGGGSGGHAGASENAAGSSSNANEVSHPDEPAEKEADAVADGVTDQLHGDKKNDKKDKKNAAGGHGGHDNANAAGGHDNGNAAGGHDGHDSANANAAGGGNANAATEKPAPISAKYIGIGRKIFRKPPATPGPAGGTPAATPASGASSNAAPAGPKKPSNDAEYQALPGWEPFLVNCTKIGVLLPEAMGFWKSCMDQLFANEDQVKKLGNDKKAILEYVDSAGARSGFSQFADAMFRKFPLPMNGDYALWSGKNAYQFAQGAGCQVLEGTQLGGLFNDVKTAFSQNWSVMQGLWRAISDAYARKIAMIMGGKSIKVFHRKKGDIFAEVESKAVKEVTDQTKTKIKYEFHALLVKGIYNFEAGYDGTPNNEDARKEVVTAAGGDENKAKQACEGQVRIFDFPKGAGPEAMQDLGALVGNESGSLARLEPNNAEVTAKLDAIKKKLTAKKTS